MTLLRSIACVMMMVAILSGCERDETTTGGTASGTGTGTGATAGTASESSTAGTASESATAGASAAAPTPAATPDASSAAAGAAAAAQTAATSDAPTTAPSGAAAATAAETTQAQKLLDQTVTYIKENKMDLAEKSLTQLEQLKPKLPVEYHSKIDGARKAFNAAKTGQGLKLDGLLPGSAK